MTDDLRTRAIEAACQAAWPAWRYLTPIHYWRKIMTDGIAAYEMEVWKNEQTNDEDDLWTVKYPRIQIDLSDLFEGRLGSYTTPIYTTEFWDKDKSKE